METVLLEILDALRKTDCLDDKGLAKIIHRHNKNRADNKEHFSKKKLLPYYLKVKESDCARWARWNVDQETERRLFQTLQVKPRRTASGVATISVITKPWKCSSDCLYCPNDLRMPKSYLSDEPACQRAERNYFDPYLQVASRLRALTQMGHATDKIELIILGGTWSDYPKAYQTWFVAELFRALNDGESTERSSKARRSFYKGKGLSNHEDELQKRVAPQQQGVNSGSLSYNQAMAYLYEGNDAWKSIAREQVSDFGELTRQHAINETARHRVVGLVIETRPDSITCDSLKLLRRLGCTKVQMGIQSLNPSILNLNNRTISLDKIHEAFELLRVFGFKIHAHFMVNLYGSSPAEDKRDYERFVTQAPYLPDEVKLYPCVLVEGTRLCEHHADKTWQPYSEDELVDVLMTDTLNTPPFIRVSRMIRDISAHDILAGNTKANLRQLVENRIEQAGKSIAEIRYREISTSETDIKSLTLEAIPYETTITYEHFLQWVTPENRIAGFLRLSLPKADYLRNHPSILPVNSDEAMIREVHIYGKAARLHKAEESGDASGSLEGLEDLEGSEGSERAEGMEGAQHLGLGRRLIKAACDIAKAQGYTKVNVISAVGTREYYRALGFKDNGLYQQMPLTSHTPVIPAAQPVESSRGAAVSCRVSLDESHFA